MSQLTYAVNKTEKYNIVTLYGELTIANKDAFYDYIRKDIGFDKLLILDLKKFQYLDSSGISSFLEIAKALQARNLHVIAMNLSDKVKNIFTLVGLNKFINVLDNEAVKKIIGEE
ncbi:MAG: STAS domain-containing protein [Spirochaetes bacterium]|nr:STAS domain-containing protein [Spirochaetota bacterium]